MKIIYFELETFKGEKLKFNEISSIEIGAPIWKEQKAWEIEEKYIAIWCNNGSYRFDLSELKSIKFRVYNEETKKMVELTSATSEIIGEINDGKI